MTPPVAWSERLPAVLFRTAALYVAVAAVLDLGLFLWGVLDLRGDWAAVAWCLYLLLWFVRFTAAAAFLTACVLTVGGAVGLLVRRIPSRRRPARGRMVT